MAYSVMPREIFNFQGGRVTITECMDDLGIAAVVWESGVRLARFLEANQQRYPMAGRSVLELGAGTGLVSIVCSLLGADVTATDLKEVLGSLSTNIANNTRSGDGRPRVRELTWGLGLSAFDGTAYDYVVASDLVYREASLGPLALTLRHFLEGARGGGGGGAGGGGAGGGAGGGGAGGGAGARGATAFFALKLRFGFCEEFVRRLRRTFRVRTLAEWPEDETVILELRARQGGEVEEEEEEVEEGEEVEEEGGEEEEEEGMQHVKNAPDGSSVEGHRRFLLDVIPPEYSQEEWSLWWALTLRVGPSSLSAQSPVDGHCICTMLSAAPPRPL
ncbi:protein-lysine methyltransferase METTL21C-like [Petromyzon marinus]|uniref:protein-lysine methyltransferase METTL21C-like n=1 Tax=Petromyzon marinus TaxID=7757 RepID=UPI003F6F45E4